MRPKLCQEAGRGTWRGGRLPIGDRTRDWTRGPQAWVRRESSAVAPQLVEEAVNDAQLAGTGKLVVDVLADRKVEHPQAERREHHWPACRHRYPPGHHVVQRAVQEVPAAGELLGQVRGGVRLQAVIDVVDEVGRSEQDLRREVAQAPASAQSKSGGGGI